MRNARGNGGWLLAAWCWSGCGVWLNINNRQRITASASTRHREYGAVSGANIVSRLATTTVVINGVAGIITRGVIGGGRRHVMLASGDIRRLIISGRNEEWMLGGDISV
jgi:hypothetical protein